MLKIDSKWGEDAQSLLHKSIEEDDPHLRKRLMALHLVASGDSAKTAAQKVGSHRITVAQWVHRFNAHGLEGLESQWKGNPGRILTDKELEELKETVRHRPLEVGINQDLWTGKAVAEYVMKKFRKKIHPYTARLYLHHLGFRYQRPEKGWRREEESAAGSGRRLERGERFGHREGEKRREDRKPRRSRGTGRKAWVLP